MAAGGGNAIRGSRVGAGPMGEAERGEAAPRQRVVYFCSHEHESVVDVRGRGADPGLLGLPALRPAGQPGLREPAAAAEDRAVQDAPRLREGAPLRQGGRGHPRRGDPDAARPPQARRDHLLSRATDRPARPLVRREPRGRDQRRPARWARRPAGSRARRPRRPAASARRTALGLARRRTTTNHTSRLRFERRKVRLIRSGGGLGESVTGDRDRVVDVELRGAGEQRRHVAVRARRRASPRRTRRLPCSRHLRRRTPRRRRRRSSCGPSAAGISCTRPGRRQVVEQRLPRLPGVAVGVVGGRRSARRPTRRRPATSRRLVARGERGRPPRWISSAMVPPVSADRRRRGPRPGRRRAASTSRPATAARQGVGGRAGLDLGTSSSRSCRSRSSAAALRRGSVRSWPCASRSRRRRRPGRGGAAPRRAARRGRGA